MSDRWSGLNVVITGGLGFIGSNLAIRLMTLGANVTVVDLPEPRCAGHVGNLAPVLDERAVIRADLAQPGAWDNAIIDADVVFHLAAQVSHSASMTDPIQDLSQNCATLLNVLSAAQRSARSPKILFTSTRQVYGRATALPLREDHVREPTDINGVHKLAAEEYLRIFRDCFGVRSTVVRLTNTYGPRMDFRSPGRGALNVFLARAVRGERIDIFGDGQQRRDILHVDDVVDALTSVALLHDPGPFHLGQPQPTSLREFLDCLNRIVPIEIHEQPFPPDLKTIDIGDSHCDASKLAALTRWAPRIALAEGLAQTVDWIRSAPHALGDKSQKPR